MDYSSVTNKEIYEAKIRGLSFSCLAREYGVSESCVRNIFKNEERKERLKHTRYYCVLKILTYNEEMITRTINVLERNGLDSDEAILNVTRKELQQCRNCGEVMINLILGIADIIQMREKG